MNKRFRTGILILIPVILLALLSQISLAQPEETHAWENHLVGFYLVRETMNSGPTSIGDPKAGWEEKGSSSVHANGLTFSIPDMILKAKTDEQRELYFPNLEGRRFFLAKEYYNPGNLEEFATDCTPTWNRKASHGSHRPGDQPHRLRHTLLHRSP